MIEEIIDLLLVMLRFSGCLAAIEQRRQRLAQLECTDHMEVLIGLPF